MAYDQFWCWRPQERVITKEPLPTDYRLSCKCCTSKYSLIAYIIFLYATFVFLTRKAFDEMSGGKRDWAGMLIPSFLGSFFLVPVSIAIRNGRPKWMQSGLILIGIVSSILLIYLLVKLITQTITYFDKNKGNGNIMEFEEAQWNLRLTLIFLAIYVPLMIWGLLVTRSYYSYIRDRQLWREQQEHQAESQPMQLKLDQPITYETNELRNPRQD